MKIVNLTNICIVAFLCCITFMQSESRRTTRTTRTSTKTPRTTVRTSTTSKKPGTSNRAVTTKITTTKRTTTLRTTTITPLRVKSTIAVSTSVHSTDVVGTCSSLVNTSSCTVKYASEETPRETTTGLTAGTMAGIGVAVTAFTAVVVSIFLIIRSRNGKHHGYKQSSANCTLQAAYSITSGKVDIDNDRLNPTQDGVTCFYLEHQAGGGADTSSSAPFQENDTALSSATAADTEVYCNLRQSENGESHSMPTPSDFTDDYSGLHQDVGAKDVYSASAVNVIYGNLQNNDSDEYNRLRSEDGGGTTLRSDVVFANNYDHLQSGDPGEYNRLFRQDGGTQCTMLPFPDTYDHLQNSSITNTTPVCTNYDLAKLERLDTPSFSRQNYENIMHVTVHNKQYN